jgi:hypothetical protein
VHADSPVAAKRLALVTSTPGWRATIYASNSVPQSIRGWRRVSRPTKVNQDEAIPLDTKGRRFSNYLVWITSLPPGNKATIAELSLKR